MTNHLGISGWRTAGTPAPGSKNATHVGAFTAKHGFTSFLDSAVGVFGACFEPEGRRFATKLRFVALASEARPRITLGAPFLVEARGRVHGLESNRSIKTIGPLPHINGLTQLHRTPTKFLEPLHG